MVYENDKCAYPCEDECLEGSNECDAYATCENTPGTYDCDCVEGFLGNGRSCENVDECRMRVHKCSANAICHDATEGAYDCECIDGYDGNGMECNDIDECSRNSHSCGENTDCINILGSYKCQCSQGFVEDFAGNTGPVDKTISRPCFDIDECNLRSHNCEGNQECENLKGTYKCKCSIGFIQNNNDVLSDNAPACMDYNECSHGEHDCSPDGTCTNSFGSYSCKCNTGFSGDGFECFDSNECTKNSHACDPLADCFDTKVIGDATFKCNTISNNIGIIQGSFECKCKTGYDGDGFTCNDFDECENNMHSCDIHADCKNTIGTYMCQCQKGYAGSGMSADCHNIDECKLRTDDCNKKGHESSYCVDNDGSFDCYCKKGLGCNLFLVYSSPFSTAIFVG